MPSISNPLRIAQLSTAESFGGAERVAWRLWRAYRERGHRSWLVVGKKAGDDPDVLQLPNDAFRGRWARLSIAAGNLLSPVAGKGRGARRLQRLGEPQRVLSYLRGHEDFDFPGTRQVLGLMPERPDILHCHNLHGGYFDLRALPWLSHELPVVLTLHDAWLLSGHCAHSFECQRWKTGCGHCPDLSIYPAVWRDGTAYNWRRKQGILAGSRLYVATPSQWLMRKVEQSILAPAVVEARVTPNAVDLAIFCPGDPQEARAALGVPQDARVLLFVSAAMRGNIFKDYPTLRAAVRRVADGLPEQRLLLLCLGEKRAPEKVGRAEVRFMGYEGDPAAVAQYYRAADLYVHAAREEAWGLAITEALACGTPVVATAVGGIPEQVKGLGGAEPAALNGHALDEATGALVPPGDVEAMALAIKTLLSDGPVRQQLARNARADVCMRFDLQRQVGDYLDWYQEILDRGGGGLQGDARTLRA